MKHYLKNMNLLLLYMSILLLGSNYACADTEFDSFIDKIVIEAVSKGVSKRVVKEFKQHVKFIPRVIQLDKSQPEFKLTLNQYLKKVVTPLRIKIANKKYQKNKIKILEISKFYGVQPRFLIALWGIETDFGRLTGGFSVVSSLATLSFEGRRRDYFKKELFNALKIIDDGHISLNKMTGSWAGAMGQCQFMPSSFLNYASDWDKNGTKDIWHSKQDVFFFFFNYLKKVGWSDEMTWGRKVDITNYSEKVNKNEVLTLKEWSNKGILKENREKLSLILLKARLIIPKNYGNYGFLVYNNFNSLLNWNRSNYFAIAVGKLSDSIKEYD